MKYIDQNSPVWRRVITAIVMFTVSIGLERWFGRQDDSNAPKRFAKGMVPVLLTALATGVAAVVASTAVAALGVGFFAAGVIALNRIRTYMADDEVERVEQTA